ncbi:MAG: DsbA family protein [Bacteroidia bacterium]|nr:DsbA family protein [Bacteroidia bacterium]
MNDYKFIYVGDPLCSWCYGIGPALDQILAKYPQFPLKVVLGGLRPYETQPMDQKLKTMLRDHWEHVQEATGQPFDYTLLETDAPPFVYNTEMPCRAVVAVRRLKPGAEWPFFKAIQDAFYHKNQHTDRLETYYPLLKALDIDPTDFDQAFDSEEVRKETVDDFMWAKQVGVTGFPTLVFGNSQELYAVSLGYAPYASMDRTMQSILDEISQEN